ncbi:MAG: ExbD/TolR family protein [Arenicellales bacterium WSBS_2016_MAG_OTU3]
MRFGPDDDDNDVQIDLAPLIDVLFLLLIFFMVTTTFSKESKLSIQLPSASIESNSVEVSNVIRIDIGADGSYAIKKPREPVAQTLINRSSSALQQALKTASEEINDPVIVVRADKRATHAAVIQAMDAAQKVGINQLTFATELQNDP